MYIGAQSTSNITDILQLGIKELVRDVGLVADVRFKTKHCKMTAKSANLQDRVDRWQIIFPVKEGAEQADAQRMMDESRIGGRVKIEGNICTITAPPFEWRQIHLLVAIDDIVESFAQASLRSQTWSLEVEAYVSSDFNINQLVEMMKAKKASDLHLRAGNRPFVRIDNDLLPLDLPVISASDMREIILQLGGEEEIHILETQRESSFQYHSAGIGYLRCSGYVKTGAMALAIRHIPEEPIPFEKLDIPPIVRDVCNKHRGLFLVCGITGSGKSTTLAAMIDYINDNRRAHVITTEDPIEFVYKDKKSLISQRQVGRDTFSFANALRGALREDPDVILVGEMRDMDTIRSGLSAAETGHLVFSTLHTTTSVDTINRIISYFPSNERDLIRQELAFTLQGVVCQRLLKRIGGGRIPCVEILIGGKPIVRDAILEGDIEKLHAIIEVDGDMRSFDQYALDLYNKKLVTREEAISACASEEAFLRQVSGIKSSEGRKILK